jgi:hypothetical protein
MHNLIHFSWLPPPVTCEFPLFRAQFKIILRVFDAYIFFRAQPGQIFEKLTISRTHLESIS